ncbi:MAG TPA: hypothetical protein VK446_11100 [Methylocystis sp.]|nr:hypothetical protein [Methylocystis sp.]
MTTITLDQAEKQLAELMGRAKAGEDIVISDATVTAVRLVPFDPSTSYRDAARSTA